MIKRFYIYRVHRGDIAGRYDLVVAQTWQPDQAAAVKVADELAGYWRDDKPGDPAFFVVVDSAENKQVYTTEPATRNLGKLVEQAREFAADKYAAGEALTTDDIYRYARSMMDDPAVDLVALATSAPDLWADPPSDTFSSLFIELHRAIGARLHKAMQRP